MLESIELQRKLQEARGEIHPSKVRIRTAAVEKEKDAIGLLELDVNPSEISNLLGIRL